MIGSPPGFFITSLQFLPLKQQIRTHDQLVKGSDYIVLVEMAGIEPASENRLPGLSTSVAALLTFPPRTAEQQALRISSL